jgi:hypothetical protein
VSRLCRPYLSLSAGGQGVIDPEDVAEAVLLAFRCSANCVPEEIILKALSPSAGAS